MTSTRDFEECSETRDEKPAYFPVEERCLERWDSWATIGCSVIVAVAFLLLQGTVAAGFMVAELAAGPDLEHGADLACIAESLESNGLCVSVTIHAAGVPCAALVVLLTWARRCRQASSTLACECPPGGRSASG